MDAHPKDPQDIATKLGDLLAGLPHNKSGQWSEIESTARNLADDLRVKDGQWVMLLFC